MMFFLSLFFFVLGIHPAASFDCDPHNLVISAENGAIIVNPP